MPDASVVVGEVLAIPTEVITVGERVRPLNRDWGHALARWIDDAGQLEPAEVCRMPGTPSGTYQLVVGRHRLFACEVNGRPLEAIVRDADALRRRAREATDLIRRGLDPISRAALLSELVDVERQRRGVTADANLQRLVSQTRWAKQAASDATEIFSVAFGWTAEIADQVGLSERAIRMDLALHRSLLPEVGDMLRDLNAGQLRAIARLDPDKQRRAAALIAEGKSPADAVRMLDPTAKAPDLKQKRLSAFLSAYDRMSKAECASALRMLAERPLPVGFAITERDR